MLPRLLLFLFACVLALRCEAYKKFGSYLPDAKIVHDVPALVALLRSPEPLDRVQALNALGDLGGVAVPVIPAIAALLSDTGGPVSDYQGSGIPTRVGERAAYVLRRIGRESIPALAEAVRSGPPVARLNAIAALDAWNQGINGFVEIKYWPVILDALQDKDTRVSAAAASIFEQWGHLGANLSNGIRGAQREVLRVNLILPIAPFLRVLKDKRPSVRKAILGFLPAIGDSTGREAIFRALHDPDAGVRETAIAIIASDGGTWLYDPRAVEPLFAALDPHFLYGSYVGQAVYALNRYDDPRINDVLLRLLNTRGEYNTLTPVMEILGERKERRAVPRLLTILRTTELVGAVGNTAAQALANIGDKSAIPALADYCLLRRPGVVGSAAFEKLSGEGVGEWLSQQPQTKP